MEKLSAQRTNLIAWKSGLTNEIKVLERNLDQLYDIVGIKVNPVVQFEDEATNIPNNNSKQQLNSDYSSIVEDYIAKISKAVRSICALISAKTEFDLPVPAYVLLKLASKIGLLRWKDHSKMLNEPARKYVYSRSPDLIDLSLLLFRVVISCLGSNIIPFTPFINSTLVNTLEWTRTSNLVGFDEKQYHVVRSQLFLTLSFMLEILSLNVNLEPGQLSTLTEVELMGGLDDLMDQNTAKQESDLIIYKDEHIISACKCFNKLILVYGVLLEVKNYIVKSCLRIYRDFESNLIRPKCRKQLLKLLQIVANQPYATSTTEMAYHVFELAEKLDDDVEVRCLVRRILSLGLTHRPTIVSHFEVHSSHVHPMKLSSSASSASAVAVVSPTKPDSRLEQEHHPSPELPATGEQPQQEEQQQHLQIDQPMNEPQEQQQMQQPQPQQPQQEQVHQPPAQPESNRQDNPMEQEEEDQQQQQQEPNQQQEHEQPCQRQQEDDKHPQVDREKEEEKQQQQQVEEEPKRIASAPASDSEVQYYMNFFVEKLASPRSIT